MCFCVGHCYSSKQQHTVLKELTIVLSSLFNSTSTWSENLQNVPSFTVFFLKFFCQTLKITHPTKLLHYKIWSCSAKSGINATTSLKTICFKNFYLYPRWLVFISLPCVILYCSLIIFMNTEKPMQLVWETKIWGGGARAAAASSLLGAIFALNS